MRTRRFRRISIVFTAVCGAVGAATSAQTVPATDPAARAAHRTAGRERVDLPPAQPKGIPVTNTSPDAAVVLQRSGGSLFRASLATPPDPGQAKLRDVSYFSVPEPEPRTIKKHDLITVIVREESAFSSKGTTDLKRESDLDARLEEFIKLKIRNFELESGGIGPVAPSVKFTASRNFKGEGTVDRSDSLTARITGEVLDVKPNGTLVVQARKTIRTDDEVQQFILTGICRAEDVSADNTLLSTQMFDLQLQKNHKGAVRDATRRGWLINLLDAISPF